jgi:uncharacterized protein YjbI with pentapeptide repeats
MSNPVTDGTDDGPEDPSTVLELSPAERADRGFEAADVSAALAAVIAAEGTGARTFTDLDLPDIDLSYAVVTADANHPIILRDCRLAALEFTEAELDVPIKFENCEIGTLRLREAHVASDLRFGGCTVGEVDAFEAQFDEEVDYTGATFEAPVHFEEATFGDDVSFEEATFEATASFEGASFAGVSLALEDEASFAGARFAEATSFAHATFEAARFTDVRFGASATFQEAQFRRDGDFSGATFEGEVTFDEVDFGEDVRFVGVRFGAPAGFRGAEFEGGARSLETDADFSDAVFASTVTFEDAAFRGAAFEGVRFEETATFERVYFTGDVDAANATFLSTADFDEGRFLGDTDFSGVRFTGRAVFRGAEFHGHANYLREDVTFEGAVFEGDADFDHAAFSSANFVDTRFVTVADFEAATFEDRLVCEALATDGDAYVDLTDATVAGGRIVQPAEGWVRYDLTRARIGSVSLDAKRETDHHELLDYFRFCLTEFDEFDFSEHDEYLERNEFALHTFAETEESVTFAETMSHDVAERTYLKAQNAASDVGNQAAAGEFWVKRQRFSRRKRTAIALDPDADVTVSDRIRLAARSLENVFMDVTCGHGERLVRITSLFALTPLPFGLAYAFMGTGFATGADQLTSLAELATPAGQSILYRNVYFSYVSYTTIGYGNIGPQGAFARATVIVEAILLSIFAALLIHTIVRRSEH